MIQEISRLVGSIGEFSNRDLSIGKLPIGELSNEDPHQRSLNPRIRNVEPRLTANKARSIEIV